MKSIVGVLFAISIAPALSVAAGLSAHRYSGESYREASQRNHGDSISDADSVEISKTTPERIKKSMEKLNVKELPDAGSLQALTAQFNYVRDTRFLKTEDPNFPRRLTWLFPDDGCYARAEMASQKLIAQKFVEPKKIFVFGDLSAKTDNASSGSVQWWYHVAVIYRVGTTPYVVDPALNPQQPMTLTEWNTAVGGDQTHVEYAICSHDTFDPDGDCTKGRPMSLEQAENEQRGFLQDEWDRLEELHRNPQEELGDNPPWKH
ncbi:protein-glutamine glutaminase family protein [Bdellovibrio sp. NC01]|uniref:protein-glutamine glutaminase family protein n=1 Tax=Bdellovibrio sp. NC01 TaxID=2220073 RepID=UPI001158F6DB|nr:protein-glutamine glutaminase family protein [Bdellovibrio sp. NC01]QDK39507.1 hypothetical protein DOE51_18845 [Bdellovibrio sp. NC01]